MSLPPRFSIRDHHCPFEMQRDRGGDPPTARNARTDRCASHNALPVALRMLTRNRTCEQSVKPLASEPNLHVLVKEDQIWRGTNLGLMDQSGNFTQIHMIDADFLSFTSKSVHIWRKLPLCEFTAGK
jgi:hypothetical protein